MSTTAPVRAPRGLALALGVVLLLPQLVLAVLIVKLPIVVGLAGFAMTLGFVRLAVVGYQVLRSRRPPLGRGPLFTIGFVATVAGALLYARVAQATADAADIGYRGVIAPPSAIGLNLVVVLVLGLWITGIVLALGSLIGALRAGRTA